MGGVRARGVAWTAASSFLLWPRWMRAVTVSTSSPLSGLTPQFLYPSASQQPGPTLPPLLPLSDVDVLPDQCAPLVKATPTITLHGWCDI